MIDVLRDRSGIRGSDVWATLLRDDRGASVAEYSIALGFLAAQCIVATLALAHTIDDITQSIRGIL